MPRIKPNTLENIMSTLTLSKNCIDIFNYIQIRLDLNQYSALRSISTTHAMINMVHTWLLTAEERKASHVVLLDYRKASDHVDHTVLVICKSYNLPNFIINGYTTFYPIDPKGGDLVRTCPIWLV